MLDLSIMLDRPCAVLLNSPDKAEALYTAINELHPELTTVWEQNRDTDNYNWHYYKEDTCYTLYDADYDGNLVLDKLYYSPRDYYEEEGYEIVEFEELLGEESELEESDMPLEEFLGI